MNADLKIPTTRFAPSPNGPLHLGHALSAIVGYQWARRVGGRFLVRIEDIDIARSRENFITAIIDDLDWLGLSWPEPPMRQSANFPAYVAAAEKLKRLGLLYPCFATRGEIAHEIDALETSGTVVPRDPDGTPLYPGIHRQLDAAEVARRLESGQRAAWRIDMAKALEHARRRLGGQSLDYVEEAEDGTARRVLAEPADWGDAVIVRKDVPASYHLAVVVDDADQGITRVTRGKDLEPATGLHCLLQVLLDLPAPRYHHHRLILGDDGSKLSKSAGATSLAVLRGMGVSAQQVRAMLGLRRE